MEQIYIVKDGAEEKVALFKVSEDYVLRSWNRLGIRDIALNRIEAVELVAALFADFQGEKVTVTTLRRVLAVAKPKEDTGGTEQRKVKS